MTSEYFYIMSNNDWNWCNAVKYGVSDNPIERIGKTDQHISRNQFINLYKYKKTSNYSGYYEDIDKIISNTCRNSEKCKELIKEKGLEYLEKIIEYIINEDGGKEFIRRDGIEILKLIITNDFIKLGIEIEEVNPAEIEKINNSSLNKKEKLELRPYQTEIINYILNEFKLNDRIFLELATGAGKTTIAYSIINEMKPDLTIILSPRTNIREQNKKYEFKLNDLKIESLCIQSYLKAYEIIKNHKNSNIFIWFDEAHWALEDWCYSKDAIKEFLLKNKKVKYRLFTSASPNKDIIIENRLIFGELYFPITMKELIDQGFLCKINIEIFDFELLKEEITKTNYIKFMCETFENHNKNYGFSFHTCCNNAYELYKIHLYQYDLKKTTIEPYLLVNDEYRKEEKRNRTIEGFKESNKSLGYVVGKYTIGYDNPKIDILFFSDDKQSYKENNQAIGRGTRINGDKELHIIIPTNYNNDIDKNYINLKGTLEYLLKGIEIEFEKIKIYKVNDNSNLNSKQKGEIEIIDDDRDITDVKTAIYDIYKRDVYWTEKKFTIQLMRKDIHNHKDYMEYYDKNKNVNLPAPYEMFKKLPNFRYIDTYRNGENPYFSKNEYLDFLKENIDNITDIIDDNEIIKILLNKSNKIPNELPQLFYGGKRKDYFN